MKKHRDRMFEFIKYECKKEGVDPEWLQRPWPIKSPNGRKSAKIHRRLMTISPTFFAIGLQAELLGLNEKYLSDKLNIN